MRKSIVSLLLAVLLLFAFNTGVMAEQTVEIVVLPEYNSFTIEVPVASGDRTISGAQIYFELSENLKFYKDTSRKADPNKKPTMLNVPEGFSVLTDVNTIGFYYMSTATYVGNEGTYKLTFEFTDDQPGQIIFTERKYVKDLGAGKVDTVKEQENLKIVVHREEPAPSAPSSQETSSAPASSAPVSSNVTSSQPSASSNVTSSQPSASSNVTTSQPSASSNVTTSQPSASSNVTTSQPSTSSNVTTSQPSNPGTTSAPPTFQVQLPEQTRPASSELATPTPSEPAGSEQPGTPGGSDPTASSPTVSDPTVGPGGPSDEKPTSWWVVVAVIAALAAAAGGFWLGTRRK